MPTFFFSAIALLTVWFILFFVSAKTRVEQIIMSLIGLLISPAIILVAANDYRGEFLNPNTAIGFDNLLFAFALFGVAAVIYEVIIGQKLSKKKFFRYEPREHHSVHQLSWIIIILGLWAFFGLSAIYILSLSSLQAFIVSGTLIGTYIIADHKNLLVNAIVSGLLTAFLVFLAEQFFFVNIFPEAAAQFWQFDRLSGFVIGGIPFEEILWAAIVGFAIGPLYEFTRSLHPKNLKKKG